MNNHEALAIRVFAERLMRIFARNQSKEECTCGMATGPGHLHDCPQHQWEIAGLLVKMELYDTVPPGQRQGV